MKIYLTIVVVLCAFEASLALKAKPKIEHTEVNHIKDQPRETKLECKFDLIDGGTETLKSVVIAKQKADGSYATFYTHAKDVDAVVNDIDDIKKDTVKVDADKAKNILTITAAVKVQGKYRCSVTTTIGSADSTNDGEELDIKEKRETVLFNIRAEGSKDDAKDKFESGNKLNAALEYELADTAGVFTHAEFKKDDLLYFNLKLDGTTATPEPQDAAKDKGVKKESVIDGKLDGTKITVSIKDAYKETEGKYKVIFYYKETTAGTELNFASNEVELHYTGGAATTMISFASISTLLMAFVFVRSNL